MNLKTQIQKLNTDELVAIGAKGSYLWIGKACEIPDYIQERFGNRTIRDTYYQNGGDYATVLLIEGSENGSFWFLSEVRDYEKGLFSQDPDDENMNDLETADVNEIPDPLSQTVEQAKPELKTSQKKEKIPVPCPYCGSVHTRKFGFNGQKQKYNCKNCGKFFLQGNEKMQKDQEKLSVFMDLVKQRRSSQSIAEICGVSVATVYNWRKQYASETIKTREYQEEILDQFIQLMAQDYTVRKATKKVGVCEATGYIWRKKYQNRIDKEKERLKSQTTKTQIQENSRLKESAVADHQMKNENHVQFEQNIELMHATRASLIRMQQELEHMIQNIDTMIAKYPLSTR